MSQGNSRTNGIPNRESNSQPNCEEHRDIGHTLANQQRPNTSGGGLEDYRLVAYQTAFAQARHQAMKPALLVQPGERSQDDMSGLAAARPP
jgi:hypothetical protein